MEAALQVGLPVAHHLAQIEGGGDDGRDTRGERQAPKGHRRLVRPNNGFAVPLSWKVKVCCDQTFLRYDSLFMRRGREWKRRYRSGFPSRTILLKSKVVVMMDATPVEKGRHRKVTVASSAPITALPSLCRGK